MMAMTPMGTAVFSITSPLGRSTRFRTAPTGSGRAATSKMPFAMAPIRSGVKARRSSITSLMCPLAAAMSSALAARMASTLSGARRASAIRSRTLCRVRLLASATACLAARAASRISCVVMGQPSCLCAAKRVPAGLPSAMS